MPTSRSILVADTSKSFDAFRGALSSAVPLVAAATLKDAKAAIVREPPVLVVCGCHFDEGRMYDLLRFLKAAPALQNVRFIAVRCTEDELLADALYESVQIAVRALGGDAFVDLLRWQRRLGPAEASHRLTQLVESLAVAAPTDPS
jgi:hypothetical protein